MSDSARPHRQRPTRLCHPWDSPGKNTGVGCHFLLQCMKVKSESEVTQSCPTLLDPTDCSLPGSFVHGILQARILEWAAMPSSRGPYIYIYTHTHIYGTWYWRIYLQGTFLPGESQGWQSLVGCCPWGRTELDRTEATWQQQQQWRNRHRE